MCLLVGNFWGGSRVKMVKNTDAALRALPEILVAARNIALDVSRASEVADIVDSVERIPLWIADPTTDRTQDVVQVCRALAAEYPACRVAAETAGRLAR
jgi:uncharacterized membrane protein